VQRLAECVFGLLRVSLQRAASPPYGYESKSGLLNDVRGPGAARVQFAYDGILRKRYVTSGSAPGAVAFEYDDRFRLTQETVTGSNGANALSFAYDNDDLLVTAGPLTLERDKATGWLSQLLILDVPQVFGYSGHGEVTSLRASMRGGAMPLLASTFTFDKRARVLSKTENGVSFAYEYDTGGRLTRELQNGAAAYTYSCDATATAQTKVPRTMRKTGYLRAMVQAAPIRRVVSARPRLQAATQRRTHLKGAAFLRG
jgi:hypothetical protein